MKKALLISAIINILLAVLAYISDITLIYPIILTTLAVIYISYQEQTITYLYKKKTKITIMAIINFIINPLSGISLLIGLDKLNTEYKNLKHKEKLKQLRQLVSQAREAQKEQETIKKLNEDNNKLDQLIDGISRGLNQ